MRNNQLLELAEDYQVNKSKMSGDERILILWDFNLSPWSVYYSQLVDFFDWMYDLTRDYTVLFTWAYRNFPLISSHIDHIFVNDGAKVDSIKKVNLKKSDHMGFFISNFR